MKDIIETALTMVGVIFIGLLYFATFIFFVGIPVWIVWLIISALK